MREHAFIEAEVTFLFESEGGRKHPVRPSEYSYRPHIVIGDPGQRRAIVGDRGIAETYLGVIFSSGPDVIEPGKPVVVEMALLFYPHPVYDSVVPGATFTIREGAKVVGFGKVMRRYLRDLDTGKVISE